MRVVVVGVVVVAPVAVVRRRLGWRACVATSVGTLQRMRRHPLPVRRANEMASRWAAFAARISEVVAEEGDDAGKGPGGVAPAISACESAQTTNARLGQLELMLECLGQLELMCR